MDERITIIIPVYNAERFLAECIHSIENQTYKNFEVIFIDDGSTDNSKQIIKQSKFDYKYIYQTNQGQGKARTVGIAELTSNWVCFCDSDDILDKNYLKKLAENVEDDIDIVACSITRLVDGMFIADKKYEDKMLTKKEALVTLHPAPYNKLYRAHVVKNADFYIKRHRYEDLATLPSLIDQANRIKSLSEVLYYYRVYEGSTVRIWDNKTKDIFIVLDEMLKYEKYNEYKEEIDFLVVKHGVFGHLSRCVYFDKKISIENIALSKQYIDKYVPHYLDNKYIKKQFLYVFGLWLLKLNIFYPFLRLFQLVEKRVKR